MSPHTPPQAYVDNYLKLLTDTDLTEFQKILDMKVGGWRPECSVHELAHGSRWLAPGRSIVRRGRQCA